jgi:hypothetical protein
MEAGPRDNEETAVDDVDRTDGSVGRSEDLTSLEGPTGAVSNGSGTAAAGGRPSADNGNGRAESPTHDVSPADFSDEDQVGDSGDDEDVDPAVDENPVEPHELRPPRKLRLWQLAPIVGLATLGSLMFAFPLAFEPGGGTGAVVAMLGLLICGCAAGWGVMAARRVGLTWPGLPDRGSGERPDWRVILLYAVLVGTVVVLAIWRVARLR